MKNPVFISNKKDQIVYIYTIYDNSLLQLGNLDEFSTTILNFTSMCLCVRLLPYQGLDYSKKLRVIVE